MHIKRALVLLLAVSLLAPTIFAVVSAADYEVPLTIKYKGQNTMVWVIETKMKNYILLDANAVDPGSLTYWYKVELSGVETWLEIDSSVISPDKVTISSNKFEICWDWAALDSLGITGNLGTRVEGTLNADTETFLAAGPGFTSSFRPR